jgi:type I restriction enzyme, R subunit
MSGQTTERAFESYVEIILRERAGWRSGALAEWDVERALFPARVFAFLPDTQPKLWAEMKTLHGAGLETLLINTLVKELDLKGALYVLRHGFKFYGKTFRVAYFKPAHGLNDEVLELYRKNQLTVTRQVPCHPGKHDTVDLLFAVNGLPVATCELKNPGTGQTWRHAVSQYQRDRDSRAPLFRFKTRTLVHFAADPHEVHMTTRLREQGTHFLPFNRGSHPGEMQCGAGNPQHPSGYRTGYFWEEVLQRDSFLDILGHFMFIEKAEEKVDDGHGGQRRIVKEMMIFPRYHQLDAVRNIITSSRVDGAGETYLIQHSAGSGKTNSISWLSHRLASLHDAADKKIFDCVIVITDRRVLDKQLQDAIYQIEHAQGVVKTIDEDSTQLAAAMIDGTQIVVTTLQKFPFLLRGLLHVAGADSQEKATEEQKGKVKEWQAAIAARKYAVIVDEAHSSQTGDAAREFKGLIGSKAVADDDEGEADWEDGLNQVMQSRGRQPNLSFFAFTATPKGKTLELFGKVGPSGLPEAFHIYSMRQAIEEGFILDVLTNYTTYKLYYNLLKTAEDDPQLPKKKGTRVLARFTSLHPYNIEQKTEVIVEHFRESVKHRVGGRAKAMVVTSSRLHAVRFKLAFERYIKENGYTDIRPLVAFSGTVRDPMTGLDYTEPGMNIDVVTGKPISEGALPEHFDSPDFQVLLVANKYQTGFDQPLLHTMYVDKRLDGVQAVQTLSRLNRMIPGKDAPFVLDFVNEAEDIFRAFKPYYDKTGLRQVSDPSQLERLKHELDHMQVYHWSEVEAYAQVFYKPPELQSPPDHAHMQRHLQPAVDRFMALEDAEQQAFRDKLGGYVKMYAFLSQIIPYGDRELEMLYSYGRSLLRDLPLDREGGAVKIGNEVELQFYRLERVHAGPIDLREGDAQAVKSPTEVGTGRAKDEKAPLSEIIEVLNERFGTEFTEEDRLFFQQIKEKAVKNEQVIKTALANPLDKFELGIRKLIEEFMIERMGENDKIVTRYMADRDFQASAYPILAREIFDAVRGAGAGEENTP